MKNAHQGFGNLVYVRRTEKASTNIRVHLDAVTGIVYGNLKSTGPPHRHLHRPDLRRRHW